MLQNRRTDDPAEKDRSESFSIPPKTYTWKQENIRTGKLPKKAEQLRAEKAEKAEKSEKAESKKQGPASYANLTFREMLSLEPPESTSELM